MNFDQDFMDWLKADDKAQGTGLLLAPVNLDQQGDDSNVDEILLPPEENTATTDVEDSEKPEAEQLAPINIDLSQEDVDFIESFNPDEEIPSPQEEPESDLPEQILIPFPEEDAEEEVEDVDEAEPEEPENVLPPEFDDPTLTSTKLGRNMLRDSS